MGEAKLTQRNVGPWIGISEWHENVPVLAPANTGFFFFFRLAFEKARARLPRFI